MLWRDRNVVVARESVFAALNVLVLVDLWDGEEGEGGGAVDGGDGAHEQAEVADLVRQEAGQGRAKHVRGGEDAFGKKE